MAEPKSALPAVTQSGEAGYLAEQFADTPGAAALRPATEAELRAAQGKANDKAQAEALRLKFEGGGIGSLVEGKLLPPLAGAARGLSLGTSDEAILSAAQILAGESGREAVRNRLLDYKQYAPVGTALGELGGIGAGALIGDEEALAGAPGVISRLGGAAERAVARGVGEGAFARGAGVLARGAVEGGAFGAGDAISEATLQNKDLTAEALVGGAAHGAVGGAVAAGAFGLAGRALSGLRAPKATEKALTDLAADAYGEAAPGVGKALSEEINGGTIYRNTPADKAARKYIDILPGLEGEQQATMREAFARRDQVFGKHAETVERASREFSSALDEALAAGRKADMASFGDAKITQVEKLVDKSRFGEQATAARQWLTDADAIVQNISKDATAGMGPSALKKWNGYVGKVESAIEGGNSIELNTALDNMKRFAGQQAAFGKGAFGLNVAQKEFDDLYQGDNGLKQLLESDIWGAKAADAQKGINSATFQMLSEGKLFTRKFTTEFGSEAGRPLYAADTSAVSGFMNRLTSAANDLDARGVQSFIDARQNYLNRLEQHYSYDAATTKAIKTERAALNKLDGVYKRATKDVTLANQVKAALSEERERGIGGAIGAVMDIANKPYTTLQRIAQLEQHTKGILDKVTKGSKALVPSAEGAVEKAATPTKSGPGFFSKLLDGLNSTVPKAAGANSRAMFERRTDQIGTMQANPLLITDRISKTFAPIEQAAPGVTTSATATALRGLDFLASKMPPSRADQFSLQPQLQTKSRASDAEISKFMHYNEALDDPLMVLREAKAGQLSRDHVEAVKAVYPQLYDKMRSEVMQSLVTSKSELPYGARIQLGILLDIPTDKTLSPDFLRAIQATYTSGGEAEAESPPPIADAPDIAGSAQTATQSAVERAM